MKNKNANKVKMSGNEVYEAYESNRDQTAKADNGKPQITLVPMKRVLEAVARVREYGNRKYGNPDNWKTVSVKRYKDALMRHLLAYLEDPLSVDEESGLLHFDHALCNMFFIKELESDAK